MNSWNALKERFIPSSKILLSCLSNNHLGDSIVSASLDDDRSIHRTGFSHTPEGVAPMLLL